MNPVQVLLVEDDPVIALYMQMLLECQGFATLLATTAEEALSCCARHRPALAILNFWYSDNAGGMKLARALRAMGPIKIFFVTGAQPEDLADEPAFESGFGTLHKPFSRAQWRKCLRDLLAA